MKDGNELLINYYYLLLYYMAFYDIDVISFYLIYNVFLYFVFKK